jgi:hypothetical protein
MWNYLLGPIFALLPKSWRNTLPFLRSAMWGRAAAVSGLAEFFGAIVALAYWYMYAMTNWVNHGVSYALSGKLGPMVAVQDIGAVALSVWATHPLTLALGYFIVEGALRFCAALSGEALGTLPLFLCDKILFGPFRQRDTKDSRGTEGVPGNAHSFFSAIRVRALASMIPEVCDAVYPSKDESGETLEICASRQKKEWDPPRVIRFEGTYYRLESCSVGAGARPFRYMLRRLAAGVPGRTVLLYDPPDVVSVSQEDTPRHEVIDPFWTQKN